MSHPAHPVPIFYPQMLLSILIPVYNAAQTIERCIKSITENNKFGDYEIIVVNDGSMDDTAKILEKLRHKESRLKIHTQDNQGTGKTRNRLLALAQGTFILFVDADDYLEPGALDLLAEHLTKEPDLDILGFSLLTKRDNEITPHLGYEALFHKYDLNRRLTGLEYLKLKNGSYFLCTQLFRRSLFQENNLRFDQEVSMCEDMLLSAEIYTLKNLQIRMLPDRLYVYDLSEESSVSRPKTWEKKQKNYHDILRVIEGLKQIEASLDDQEYKEEIKTMMYLIVFATLIMLCKGFPPSYAKDFLQKIVDWSLFPIKGYYSASYKEIIFSVIASNKHLYLIAQALLSKVLT